MKQGLYEKLVMICRKDSDKKRKKENKKNELFQGISARSISWYDSDREWLE